MNYLNLFFEGMILSKSSYKNMLITKPDSENDDYYPKTKKIKKSIKTLIDKELK